MAVASGLEELLDIDDKQRTVVLFCLLLAISPVHDYTGKAYQCMRENCHRVGLHLPHVIYLGVPSLAQGCAREMTSETRKELRAVRLQPQSR